MSDREKVPLSFLDGASIEGGSSNDPRKDTNPKDAAAAVQGRVPLGLFPDTAIILGAMAMWEGACKYGRYNYRVAGVRASVYNDAARRHLTAWWNGEDDDPDSGLHHLTKALACLAVLIDAIVCGKMTDDRPPRAPAATMLAELREAVKDIEERYADMDPHQYTINDSPEQDEDLSKLARQIENLRRAYYADGSSAA